MPHLTIDNIELDFPPGTTVLEAARQLGIEIPTLCHYPGCTPQTSCLVCLVRINGGQRAIPSCATIAAEGMKVESETPAIHALRRTALELLLAEHTGDCFAPCQNICPAHMDIPTMMRQIESGLLADAIITVKSAIPLPAVLGRICPELCEKGCRRGHLDSAVTICSLKRYVADKDLASNSPYLPACAPATGKHVAIVGTGPAGLTAAWFLLQRGHAVTLYDQQPLPGGALRYAIDESRLPRDVLDGEIGLVQKLGARFVMNAPIGGTITGTGLRRECDAVILATGPLDLPRAQAMGVGFAGQGIKIDRKTMMTPIDGIFAAGGAILPLRHAIRAVADGRTVAENVDRYLRGAAITGKPAAVASKMGKLEPEELVAFMKGTPQTPRWSAQTPSSDAGSEVIRRLGSARAEESESSEYLRPGVCADGADAHCTKANAGTDEGVAGRAAASVGFARPVASAGLDDTQATQQAARCAHCDCGKLGGCRLRQLAEKYNANPSKYRGLRRSFARIDTHPLLIYEPGKCLLCGLCVDISQSRGEGVGLTFQGRGFGVTVTPPLKSQLSDALTATARRCAEACPTGALLLRGEATNCEEQLVAERGFRLPLRVLQN